MEQICNTTIPIKSGSIINESIIVETKQVSSHILQIKVKINSNLINPVRHQILLIFKKIAFASGLSEIPLSYIEQNYQREINNYLSNFIYNYFVVDFILEELSNKKVFISNSPRLKDIKISNEEITYSFDISMADLISIREWKNFVFKSPKRKNYKDLDKQVDLFIKKMQEDSKKCRYETVEVGDWVCFGAQVAPETEESQFLDHDSIFWIHIVPHPIRNAFIELFINKNLNESFIVPNLPFKDYEEFGFSNSLKFKVKIIAITKGSHTSIETLKTTFKISNKEKLHDKLIEVFSYRNDQTQRHAIIEEMFHLLLSKHRFEIPKHLILRKQEEILSYLQRRPDFEAYRSQNDFFVQVITLAEKQLKEEIITDQIAYTEKIRVDIKDIQNYLNLFSNPRLKEFIYFKSLFDYSDDFSYPIHHAILKQICRREKTLNHILFHLTR